MSVETNTFQGLHASHYDLIYAEKPYPEEARLVAGLLGREAGRLLDLACGTGRHAVEFAVLGFEVTGVDYNEQLLEVAKGNATRAGVAVDLVHADMRELDLGREFDAVVCLFDSIGYPCTDEGVIAALRSARRHLSGDGLLVAEFLHAPALLAGASPVRVRRWQLPNGGELLRVSETTLDPERSIMKVDYDLIELEPGGEYKRGTESQQNRFFTVDGMQSLMQEAGLDSQSFVPGHGQPETMDESTWHVLGVARPAEQ